VNRPSVEALRPDHGWGNSCHTQPCRTRQERKCGGERGHATGIAEEEDGRNSGETGSPEQWRRKKNLRSGLPLSWK
jgi:hypothetical protein